MRIDSSLNGFNYVAFVANDGRGTDTLKNTFRFLWTKENNWIFFFNQSVAVCDGQRWNTQAWGREGVEGKGKQKYSELKYQFNWLKVNLWLQITELNIIQLAVANTETLHTAWWVNIIILWHMPNHIKFGPDLTEIDRSFLTIFVHCQYGWLSLDLWYFGAVISFLPKHFFFFACLLSMPIEDRMDFPVKSTNEEKEHSDNLDVSFCQMANNERRRITEKKKWIILIYISVQWARTD